MRSYISSFKSFFSTYRVGLSLVLLLVGAELVFRLTFFGPIAVIKPWQYLPLNLKLAGLMEDRSKNAPNHKLAANKISHFKGAPFSTNSYGFRDREFSIIKPESTIRIAVLGASVSMGSGVQDHEIYSRVLQKLFEQHGYPQVEILNFAVGGYSIVDIIASYEAYIARFHADVVILNFFPEKTEIAIKPHRKKAMRRKWHQIQQYLGYSFIANWLRVDMNSWRRKNLAKDWRKRDRDASRAKTVDNLKVIKAFHKKLSIAGTELFLIKLPFPGKEKPLAKFGSYNDRLQATLDWLHRSNDVSYVDYEKQLADQITIRDTIYPGDDHPNARAHRLYAKVVYQDLEPFLFSR